MTWVKFGDEYGDETATLSDAAYRTHGDALGYSARLLLDLVIPKKALIRFANSDSRDAAAYELVAAEWWEDRGPEWYIGLRHPEWQLEKADVERSQEKSRVRQMRRRRHVRGDHSECLPSACPDAMSRRLSQIDSQGLSRGDSRRGSREKPDSGQHEAEQNRTESPSESRRESQGLSGSGRDGTGRVGTESLPPRPEGAAPKAAAPDRTDPEYAKASPADPEKTHAAMAQMKALMRKDAP